jgi:hypothetical protein
VAFQEYQRLFRVGSDAFQVPFVFREWMGSQLRSAFLSAGSGFGLAGMDGLESYQ